MATKTRSQGSPTPLEEGTCMVLKIKVDDLDQMLLPFEEEIKEEDGQIEVIKTFVKKTFEDKTEVFIIVRAPKRIEISQREGITPEISQILDLFRKMQRVGQDRGPDNTLQTWQRNGILMDIYPLHCPSTLAQVRAGWSGGVFGSMPIPGATGYFGFELGGYFLWLKYYTLLLLIFLGLSLMVRLLAGWLAGVVVTFAWSSAVVLFSIHITRMLEKLKEEWSKREKMVIRPVKQAHPSYDPTSTRLARTGKQLVSIFVIFMVAMGMIIVTQAIFQTEPYLFQLVEYTVTDFGFPTQTQDILKLLPEFLLSVKVALGDSLVRRISQQLSCWEGYHWSRDHTSAVISKSFVLGFLNHYVDLMYVVFYLQDHPRAVMLLNIQLIVLHGSAAIASSGKALVLRAWITVAAAIISYADIPLLRAALLVGIATLAYVYRGSLITVPSQPHPTQPGRGSAAQRAISESSLEKFIKPDHEYLDIILGFGKVFLISGFASSPLFLHTLDTVTRAYTQLHRLLHMTQRPLPTLHVGTGFWGGVQGVMTVVGVGVYSQMAVSLGYFDPAAPVARPFVVLGVMYGVVFYVMRILVGGTFDKVHV